MASDASTGETGLRRGAEALLMAVVVAVVLVPYLGRLKHPSLYTDDVVRIAQLQTVPLQRLLFLPFNEHMAPLFQGLSWLVWQLAGRSLVRAPMAFTMASYVPFGLSLGLLGWVIRAETRSVATSMVSLAIFGLSWLASETVYWYSASSFMWALAFTMAAWLGAASAAGGQTLRGSIGMGVASALAPAWSAIGLLAGPLAIVRVLAADFRGGPRRRAVAVVAPIAGTLAYLSVCSVFRYGDVLAQSIERNVHLRAGLIATGRAPIDYLLPGLFGLHPIGHRLSPLVSLTFSSLGVSLALLWAWRSGHRALTLGGLLLILGGYGLTFCGRGDQGGRSVLVAQRYHLFPQLGLVLVLAPLVRIGLRRWEARPHASLLAVASLTVVLALVHAPMLKARGRYYRHPDQVRTLAAMERLGTICRELRITRDQAIAALDPIQPGWSPPNANALEMLARTVDTSNYPDSRVRPDLLAALTTAEREALCGGMDASRHLQRIVDVGDLDHATIGQLVGSFRVTALEPGRWITSGWPSYLEFAVPATTGPGRVATSASPAQIRAIGLPMDMPGALIEVWWRGDHDRWSETRSVRCRLAASQSGQGQGQGKDEGWAIPTDRLPHWESDRARHLRLFFRTPGVVAAGAPRLIR
jgi:hypothetical protein